MEIESDFLVIGSGIAGLSFALKAARFGRVNLVTKKDNTESNTNYAQGGIAVVVSPEDSFQRHVEDTLEAGAGLCHPDAVEMLVREGPCGVRELMDWGVRFSLRKAGVFDLGREGGHSVKRIVHAADLTGREVERALVAAAKANPNITIFENHQAVDLLTEHHLKDKKQDGIHCWGAYVLDEGREVVFTFKSMVTFLATGGVGQVYLHTTNPGIATGDGIAMAYRAGASVANLEFTQFHPTTLYHPDANSFLISERLRGYGAVLKTKDGRTFMENYHPQGCLAPRDVVARAIDNELKKRGEDYVLLDATHLDKEGLRSHFPTIYQKCLSYNLDVTEEPIPVVPAAHYICGGVVTDLDGRTSIEGLFAGGEVACTGVHGANRLASNSLLEAVVFSDRAVKGTVKYWKEHKGKLPLIPTWSDEGTFDPEEWVLISHDKQEIQRLMWDYVGIVRATHRLKRAQERIQLIAKEVEDFYRKTRVTEGLIELRNITTVALLIIESAMRRKESRGLHYILDYPNTDDKHWKKDTIL